MKLTRAISAVCAVLFCGIPAVALNDGQCLTPPMGFNTWNWFACGNSNGQLNDALIRGIADAMVSSGMRDVGYRYVNLDDCWAEGGRDTRGGLVPNRTRFPDWRGLINYVHSKGLRIGIYTDTEGSTCAGTMPGAKGREQQDADSMIAWGIDYLKYDWCNAENTLSYAMKSYTLMRDCLRKSVDKAKTAGNTNAHFPIYSICNWGLQKPWTWGDTVGHLWRTTFDISMGWDSWTELFEQNATLNLHQYAGPGHWNDPDMLEVGNGSPANEDRAHFTMWCMLAAPLIAGNDLRKMTQATKDILTNAEVIAVDQDSLGKQGRRIRNIGGGVLQIWAKELRGGDIALCVFNKGSAPTDLTITWSEIATGLGMTIQSNKTYKVRDLWKKTDLSDATGSILVKGFTYREVTLLRLISGDPVSTSRRASRAAAAGFPVRMDNGALVIDNTLSDDTRITLLDTRGAIVATGQVSAGVVRIDARGMKPGTYAMEFRNGAERFSRMWVVR